MTTVEMMKALDSLGRTIDSNLITVEWLTTWAAGFQQAHDVSDAQMVRMLLEYVAAISCRPSSVIEVMETVVQWIETGKVDGVSFDEVYVTDVLRSVIAGAKGKTGS